MNSKSPHVEILGKPFPVPQWAYRQQQLIERLRLGAREFVDRYVRADGTLIWRDRWPGMDGSDDPYEAFQYFPLFYALTGDEEIYELGRKIWNGITWQWTEYGQIHREFDGYYDWMHHGEANLFSYFLGLTKPESLQDRQRAHRFAQMYTGDDLDAPNFDTELGIIRGPMTGSRGPRFVTTHEDWITHRGVLDDYHAPFEDMETSPFELGKCRWSDDAVYDEVVRLMNERMTRGDVPVNLNASGQMLHAFMYSADDRYREWVLRYLTGWLERARANNGIIPDNVGLSGVVGEYLDGKWWGGHYGWRWPHGWLTIIEPIVNICSNALLLTGDQDQLTLAREQMDLNWNLGQDVAGSWHTPHKHFDSGWTDYRPASPYHAIHLWARSLAAEDFDRVERARAGGLRWSEVTISEKPFGVKHYNTNTLPWFEYISGRLPGYPDKILEANNRLIDQQLARLRSDDGDPAHWDEVEQINDYHGSLSMQVDGYAIHAWQEFNPLYFESLVQLQWGTPMHISHGGMQFAAVRYFDPATKKPGLPAGVSALVSALTAETTTLTLANTTAEPAEVIIQAGAFAEHRVVGVQAQGQSEPQRLAEPGTRVGVSIPAESAVTLGLHIERNVNPPSYETPFSERQQWGPLIMGRHVTSQ